MGHSVECVKDGMGGVASGDKLTLQLGHLLMILLIMLFN